MTRWHGMLFGVSLLVIGLTGPLAFAQTPLTAQPDFALLNRQPSLPDDAQPLVLNPVQLPHERWGGPWGVDAVLGLPTGLRVEKFLSADVDHSVVLEGFAGLYIILPTVGAGVRWHGWAFGSEQDTLILSPGLDAFLLFNPFTLANGDFGGGRSTAGLIGVDVDCAWRHTFDRHWSSEFGLKVGGGVGFSKTSIPVPLLGLYGGFRF